MNDDLCEFGECELCDREHWRRSFIAVSVFAAFIAAFAGVAYAVTH